MEENLPAEAPGPDPGRGAVRDRILVALTLAVHLSLVARFAPREAMLGTVPILHDAFAVEAYRVAKMQLALALQGRPFLYDPSVAAGQVVGFVERFGTRLFVVAVPWLSRAHVPPFRAFNLVVLGLHAAVPLVALGAARAFSLGRRGALVLAALWSSLWFFDSLFHFAWFSGRAPWVLASMASVAGSGLAQRARGGGVGAALGATAVFALASLVHPIATAPFLIVGVALALLSHGALPGTRLRMLAIHGAPALVLLVPMPALGALTSEPIAPLVPPELLRPLWGGTSRQRPQSADV